MNKNDNYIGFKMGLQPKSQKTIIIINLEPFLLSKVLDAWWMLMCASCRDCSCSVRAAFCQLVSVGHKDPFCFCHFHVPQLLRGSLVDFKYPLGFLLVGHPPYILCPPPIAC